MKPSYSVQLWRISCAKNCRQRAGRAAAGSTLHLLVTQRTGERQVQATTTTQKAAAKVKNQSILSPLESFGEGKRRLMRRREWQLKIQEGMKSCSKQVSSNSTRGAQQGFSYPVICAEPGLSSVTRESLWPPTCWSTYLMLLLNSSLNAKAFITYNCTLT